MAQVTGQTDADAVGVLRRTFGYREFRPHQERIVRAALAGRDVLAVMPTSAGKSICYQVPAIMLPGVAVVVSPLISLMADQVGSLRQAGVAADCLTSAQTGPERAAVLSQVRDGLLDLLYVAPERLDDTRLVSAVDACGACLLAVDEAHCISQWGNDFRPSYQRIRGFVDALGARVPIMALTATATERVRTDIASTLGLDDPLRVVASFDRPNLSFAVERPETRRQRDRMLVALCRERAGRSGIVYCSSRRAVEESCELLCEKGIAATRYHAGLTPEERARNQEDFLFDRRRVMVATNAFGRGIDKSNVGFVIHYNMPLSLEAYYQEAGRAGRDGTAAECVLLYMPGDVHTAEYLMSRTERDDLAPDELAALRELDEERLRQMTFYCTTPDCLRHFILRYFGEDSPARCGNCGNCTGEFVERDVTEDALKAVSCVARLAQRRATAGVSTIVDILRGSTAQKIFDRGFDTLSTYGILRERNGRELRDLMGELERRGLLARTGGEYPVVTLTATSMAFLRRDEPFDAALTMRVPKPRPKPSRAVDRAGAGHGSFGGSGSAAAGLHGVDEGLYEQLRALRRELAQGQGVPPYVICTNATLEDMCARRPTSCEEMLEVSGMGANRVRRYGERFVRAIEAWRG